MGRNDKQVAVLPDTEFGIFLFERKVGRWVYAVLAVLLAGGAGFLVYILATKPHFRTARQDPTGFYIGFVVCSLLAALCVWRFMRGVMSLSFHQGGVIKTYAGQVQRLPYDAVEGISYSVTRQYVNGAYSGTNLAFKIIPMRDLMYKPFSYSGRHQEKLVGSGFLKKGHFEGADELDELRDHISAIIATRMICRIDAGELVPWYGRVTLARDGVRVGGKLYPWDQIKSTDINQGSFTLKAEGKFLSASKSSVNVMNFFPGFIALRVMLDRATGAGG